MLATHLALPREPGRGDSFQTDWLTPLALSDYVGAISSSEQEELCFESEATALLGLITFAVNKLQFIIGH